MNTCEKCKYYHEKRCKRFPQSVKKEPGDFCGEWQKQPVPLIKLSPKKKKPPRPPTDAEMRERARRDTSMRYR